MKRLAIILVLAAGLTTIDFNARITNIERDLDSLDGRIVRLQRAIDAILKEQCK